MHGFGLYTEPGSGTWREMVWNARFRIRPTYERRLAYSFE